MKKERNTWWRGIAWALVMPAVVIGGSACTDVRPKEKVPLAAASDSADALHSDGLQEWVKFDPMGPQTAPFSHHNFSAFCFDVTDCFVLYGRNVLIANGPGEISPGRNSVKNPGVLGSSYVNMPAFAGQVNVMWRGRDGAARGAYINLDQMFRDGRVRQGIDPNRIAGDAILESPDIYLVIEDDVVKVFMKAFISEGVEGKPGIGHFDSIEVWSLAPAANSPGAVASLEALRPGLETLMLRNPKGARASGMDKLKALYDEFMSAVNAMTFIPMYDDKDPHQRLFVAMFDKSWAPVPGKAQPPTYLFRMRSLADQIAYAYPSVRVGYIAMPAPGGEGSYDSRNTEGLERTIAVQRMYERLSAQVWEWKKSDPDMKLVLVTPALEDDKETRLLFLDKVNREGVADRANLRVTGEIL